MLYAAMFSVSGLVVFAIVAWLVSSFMAEQLDATVANELAEVQADAGGRDTQTLKQVITGLTVNSPGIHYLLQAPDGQVIAGNMTAIEPKPGLRSLEWTHPALERRSISGMRGRGIVLPDGAYLFVCISDYQLGEVREVVLRTSLLGLGVTVVLAVARTYRTKRSATCSVVVIARPAADGNTWRSFGNTRSVGSLRPASEGRLLYSSGHLRTGTTRRDRGLRSAFSMTGVRLYGTARLHKTGGNGRLLCQGGESAMPFYENADVRIRYEEAGSAFPLLVVPSGGLNSRISN